MATVTTADECATSVVPSAGAKLAAFARMEPVMPLLNVRLIEGVFTPAQKQEMVRKLTDTMVAIEGENLRSSTVVVIDEVKSGDWGFGGKPLTTQAVRDKIAGRS
jgi:4-oxalocrotonate tautomerase